MLLYYLFNILYVFLHYFLGECCPNQTTKQIQNKYNNLLLYLFIVKYSGSQRLTVDNEHLHSYCYFTELFLETVGF